MVGGDCLRLGCIILDDPRGTNYGSVNGPPDHLWHGPLLRRDSTSNSTNCSLAGQKFVFRRYKLLARETNYSVCVVSQAKTRSSLAGRLFHSRNRRPARLGEKLVRDYCVTVCVLFVICTSKIIVLDNCA